MILLGICPGCRAPLELRRPLAARCSCGEDLLAGARARLMKEHVEADAYLLGRLGRGSVREVPLLDGLCFGSAAGLMLNIGGSLDPNLKFNRTWNPGSARSHYGSVGLRILDDGWEAFDSALSRMREIAMIGRTRANRLVGYYGRLQHWLGHERTLDLEPFRARLLAHAGENAPVSANTRIFGSPLKNAERMTMNAAMIIIGKHPGPIFGMLKALGLEDQATGYSRADLIDVAAVERVKREFPLLVDSGEVKIILGCSDDQLRCFIASGIVRKFYHGIGTATSYYRRAEVERVASVLLDGLPTVEAVPPDLIILLKAGQYARIKTSNALWAAMHGKLKPRALLAAVDGHRSVQNVLVDRSDLRRFAQGAGPRGYTRTEAAQILNLSRRVVGKLVDLVAPDWGRNQLFDSDVRAIRARFVTPREIQAAHSGFRSLARVVTVLACHGVRPLFEEPYVNLIFDREAVESVLGTIPLEPLRGGLVEAEQGSR